MPVTPPALSVVIPVFNEPRWITGTIEAVVTAFEGSPFPELEVVVVDDGSTDATPHVLDAVRISHPYRVIRQENAGRLAARLTGVRAARHPLVLLIDSRVTIHPDALAFVARRGGETGVHAPWNAHVDIDVAGNPFARFWNILTEIAFHDYFGDPRTTSFGPEEFDRFPKGTTMFLAERVPLIDAMESFTSHFDDARMANDDTPVIRMLAEHARINISPGFRCTYRGRSAPRAFLRHAYHRGTVLVDGYLRPGARFRGAVLAFPPLSALAAAALVLSPRTRRAAALGVPLAAMALGARFRRGPRDVATLALIGPPWIVAYGLGIWRGVALVVRRRWAR